MAAEEDWFVYLLKCGDGTFYCGITKDLAARVEAHNEGRGAKYTRGRGPVEVVAQRGHLSHADALRLEIAVKKAPRAKKATLLGPPG